MRANEEPDADPEEIARAIVLRLLTIRARTREELSAALTRRHVPAETAARVLDRMEQVGLVNDREFARNWVESRQQRRALSRQALRVELQRKGIERDDIESALAVIDGDDELDAAQALVDKKRPALSELDPSVRYRRLAGMLARRGFSSGIISTVLSDTAER